MAIPRPGTSQFEAFTTNLAYARKVVDAGRYLAPFQPGRNIWQGAAVQINTWQGGRTAYTDKTLKAQFMSITTRRNKIAHDADLVAGDLKRRRSITEPDVTDAINWIDRIALAVAHVLDE
ncbi:hypothetical protein OG782_12355 [Streptomyces sp. NBC_00876]|uniref:hypothetical protein n=1 Tax=Streptomyces sp. NBC_00876 TaxID=2975853 RepID=UPI0038684CCA|nr:hypothetical protein OG782_12355 [Streptomyces sp. NBC_00876]